MKLALLLLPLLTSACTIVVPPSNETLSLSDVHGDATTSVTPGEPSIPDGPIDRPQPKPDDPDEPSTPDNPVEPTEPTPPTHKGKEKNQNFKKGHRTQSHRPGHTHDSDGTTHGKGKA